MLPGAAVLLTSCALLPSLGHGQVTVHHDTLNLAVRADSLFAAYASPVSPGCTVGVLRARDVILRTEYGMADVAAGRRIGPTSVFPVQSMQKMFLANAILRLAQQGRLHLDAPIVRWLPSLARMDSGVTLRRLIQHTSGLPDVGNLVQFLGWPAEDYHSRQQWIDVIGRSAQLNFAPGTRESYSNDGQVLLPSVIEAVTGQSIDRALALLVFRPRGMRFSSYRRSPATRPAGLVTPYRATTNGKPAPSSIAEDGVLTTRDDLLTWAGWWLRSNSSEDSLVVEAMRERAMLQSGSLTEYGLGLAHITYRGVDAWYHGGDSEVEGHSMLILWPRFHSAVVVLCNGGGIDNVTGLAVQLSEMAFADLWAAPDVAASADRDKQEASANAAAGLYFTADGGPTLRRFAIRSDTLVLQIAEDDIRPLQRLGSHIYGEPTSTVRWMFRADTAWRTEGLAVVRFIRVRDIPSADLSGLSGCFRDAAYGAGARILRRGDSLFLRWDSDTTSHLLTARFTDGFSDGFVWLQFRRDVAGRVSRMTAYQRRVWRMELVRKARCQV